MLHHLFQNLYQYMLSISEFIPIFVALTKRGGMDAIHEYEEDNGLYQDETEY